MNQMRFDRVDCALEGQNDLGCPQVYSDSANCTHGALRSYKGTVGSFWVQLGEWKQAVGKWCINKTQKLKF